MVSKSKRTFVFLVLILLIIVLIPTLAFTDVQTLSEAKIEAKNEILSAFSGYVQSDYTTSNWTSLLGFKSAGEASIDASLDFVGVNISKVTALTGMNGVETVNKTLNKSKITAKAELAAALASYVAFGCPADILAELSYIKLNGDSSIDVAIDIAGIFSAKTTTLSCMEEYKGIINLHAQKTAAKSSLAEEFGFYTEGFYSEYNWASLNAIRAQGDTAIDNATDTLGVVSAKNTALVGMAKVERLWPTYTPSLGKVYPLYDLDKKYLLPEVYTGNVTVEFDLTAELSTTEVIVGLIDKDAIPLLSSQWYNAFSIEVSLYSNNKIRAINGGVWFETTYTYTPNETYHFRIEANMIEHSYDLYVTPSGENEMQIASDFAFRTIGQPPVIPEVCNADDISMVIVASQPNGFMENFSIIDDTPPTLLEAKIASKANLSSVLGTYVESYYTAENWAILAGYKTSGDSAINAASDLEGVYHAKTAAITGMAAVEIKPELILAAAKAEAKADLTAALGLYSEGFYTPVNWTTLNTAKVNGDAAAIDSAEDTSGVAIAKNAALNQMAAIERLWPTYSTIMGKVYPVNDLDSKYLLPEVYTGNVTMEFDLTATSSGADVYACFADKDVVPTLGTTQYNGMSMMICMFNTGKIRIRNGGAWYDSAWSYEANKKYHFRVTADMTAHTYAVYVTPEGGAELTLGTAFQFRSSLPAAANADDVAMVVVSGAGSGFMDSLTISDDSIATTLTEARIIAKAELAAAYKACKESDYTVENWAALTGFKTDGDLAIDSASDYIQVVLAKNAAIGQMAAVETIAEQLLVAAKTSAKADLSAVYGAYTESHYTGACWISLSGFKTAGDTAIDEAVDFVGVDSAKATAINNMAGVIKMYRAALDPVYNKNDTIPAPASATYCYMLPEIYTGLVTIEFDMQCLIVPGEVLSAQVGFVTDSVVPVFDSYNEMSIPIAMHNLNIIARNGSTWTTGPAIVKDKIYRIKILADMTNHSYDVWVDNILIGTNLAFRNGGTEVQNAPNLSMVSVYGSEDNQIMMSNLVVSDNTP